MNTLLFCLTNFTRVRFGLLCYGTIDHMNCDEVRPLSSDCCLGDSLRKAERLDLVPTVCRGKILSTQELPAGRQGSSS